MMPFCGIETDDEHWKVLTFIRANSPTTPGARRRARSTSSAPRPAPILRGDGRLTDLRYWKSFVNLAIAWELGTLPAVSGLGSR